jgi:hypothetical protein
MCPAAPWPDKNLNTQAGTTETGNLITAGHLIDLIGPFALGQLAKRLSTRSVRLARMILIQATATRW